MKEIKRHSQARWTGDLRSGKGTTTTESKVLDGDSYSVGSRFETGSGTNPEELIAAAQASCFSMMLAKILGDQKKAVEQIDTEATLVLRQENGHAKISEIHLRTEVKVVGMDATAFQKAAEEAKENCPVSVLLKPGLEKITLEARLV